MAKTYFSQYIDDINRIIKESINKHDMASIALENARKRNEKARADSDYSFDKKIVEAARFREAEAEYRESMKSLQDETDTAFQTLRQSLVKHIAEYTAADPGKVDQSAVMLLNSGSMRDTDLVALANKYWNNPTMLKLVAGEAEKNLTNSKTARSLAMKITEYISPDTRLRVFDDTVSIAKRTIQNNEHAASTFQRLWDEQFYSSAKHNMATLDSFNMEVM